MPIASRSSKCTTKGATWPGSTAVVISGLRKQVWYGRQTTQPLQSGDAGVLVGFGGLQQPRLVDRGRAEGVELERELCLAEIRGQLTQRDRFLDEPLQQR